MKEHYKQIVWNERNILIDTNIAPIIKKVRAWGQTKWIESIWYWNWSPAISCPILPPQKMIDFFFRMPDKSPVIFHLEWWINQNKRQDSKKNHSVLSTPTLIKFPLKQQKNLDYEINIMKTKIRSPLYIFLEQYIYIYVVNYYCCLLVRFFHKTWISFQSTDHLNRIIGIFDK